MNADAFAGPLDPPHARRVHLDFRPPCQPDWMAGSYPASCLMNAYSLVFPALETLMVRYVSSAANSTDADTNAAAVRGFLQQEGSHAREHRRSLDCVRLQGYDIDKLQRRIDWIVSVGVDAMLRRFLRPIFGHAFAVAIFAAAEHWTASMSEMALVPGGRRVSIGRLEQSVPPTDLSEMEILFLWHVAEEIEHKSVVADLSSALGGGELARISAFLLATPVFLLVTGLGFGMLLRQAPTVLGEREWARRGGWRGLARTTRQDLSDVPKTYVRAITSYLRRGFHPSQNDTDAVVRQAFDRLHALLDGQASKGSTG